jgi:DNA invertase Pin-like site-specific DNA recombinase
VSRKTPPDEMPGERPAYGTHFVGCPGCSSATRASTDAQDLTAQRDALQALGVPSDRLYVDHGLTGAHRDRPGLREALAACRAGDTLVTKLDRLARSLPDTRDIVEDLTRRHVGLNLGGSIHDPTDPVGRLLFNVLAMVAGFEADLIRARTREGMKVAKAKGRLRGKQPKLTARQEAYLVALHRSGQHTSAELAELFKSPARPSAPACDDRGPHYVKAMSHPLRVRILAMLDERIASPTELAGWLHASLGTVAFHVRTL